MAGWPAGRRTQRAADQIVGNHFPKNPVLVGLLPEMGDLTKNLEDYTKTLGVLNPLSKNWQSIARNMGNNTRIKSKKCGKNLGNPTENLGGRGSQNFSNPSQKVCSPGLMQQIWATLQKIWETTKKLGIHCKKYG